MKKPKFNFIDVIIILVVIAVGIIGFSILTDQEDSLPTSIVQVKVRVEFDNIDVKFEKTIKSGDQLIALNTKQSGLVHDIIVEPFINVEAINGQLVETQDPSYCRIIVLLDITSTQYGPYMDFSGNELKSGKSFDLETDDYAFSGKIIDVKVVD